MIGQTLSVYPAAGVVLLGAGILVFTFIWLMNELESIGESRKNLGATIEEIDDCISTFGFGASKAPADTTYRGTASAADTAIIRAPLSGRPCLAYRIELGHQWDDDLVEFERLWALSEAIPFHLGDQFQVVLEDGFRFSPADTSHRRAFRPEELDPSLRERLTYVFPPSRWEERHTFRSSRFYEWILPPDTPCEFVGQATLGPLDYRNSGMLQLVDAKIHVGPREDDSIELDRLRRVRIASLHGLGRMIRLRRRTMVCAICSFGLSCGIFWVLFTATSLFPSR